MMEWSAGLLYAARTRFQLHAAYQPPAQGRQLQRSLRIFPSVEHRQPPGMAFTHPRNSRVGFSAR